MNPHCELMRQCNGKTPPSKALVRGLARELDITESYLDGNCDVVSPYESHCLRQTDEKRDLQLGCRYSRRDLRPEEFDCVDCGWGNHADQIADEEQQMFTATGQVRQVVKAASTSGIAPAST